jgi:hypothetical protein
LGCGKFSQCANSGTCTFKPRTAVAGITFRQATVRNSLLAPEKQDRLCF